VTSGLPTVLNHAAAIEADFTGAIDVIERVQRLGLQACRCHENLEYGARRIAILDDTIPERFPWIGVEFLHRYGRDFLRKQIRIEGGLARQNQYVAGRRIHRNNSTYLVAQSLFRCALQIQIQCRVQIIPGKGFFGAETLDFSLPIVDDNSSITILPAKDRVITKFKSEFADLISGLVLLRIVALQFVGRHFSEITDGMSRKVSFEVTSSRLILDKNFVLEFEFAGIDERDIGDVDIFLEDDWTILWLRSG